MLAQMFDKRLVLLIQRLGLSGPIRVSDVFDIVAIADGDAQRIESMLRELFGWQHSRAIAGMQIAFAPAVVAAFALASRGPSPALALVAGVVLAGAMAAGIWRVRGLHRFDSQYFFASALAKTVADLHSDLWPRKRGTFLPSSSSAVPPAAATLYDEAGGLTLAQCISDRSAQVRLAQALEDAE